MSFAVRNISKTVATPTEIRQPASGEYYIASPQYLWIVEPVDAGWAYIYWNSVEVYAGPLADTPGISVVGSDGNRYHRGTFQYDDGYLREYGLYRYVPA